MGKFRLLAAVISGTVFYVITSISCGRNSVWAERQMEEQRRLLSAHAVEIEKINEELSLEKVALEKDMDVVAAYARKLSYLKDGEKLVIISGLASSENRIYDPGTVLLHDEVKYFPEWFCKCVGLVAFTAVYFILLMFDAGSGLLHYRGRRPGEHNGKSREPQKRTSGRESLAASI
ncbi:MAG: septum formation initiator family protein [Treponema sp.]|nr:septum formation initiator family protein [Treponema sp.]